MTKSLVRGRGGARKKLAYSPPPESTQEIRSRVTFRDVQDAGRLGALDPSQLKSFTQSSVEDRPPVFRVRAVMGG